MELGYTGSKDYFKIFAVPNKILKSLNWQVRQSHILTSTRLCSSEFPVSITALILTFISCVVKTASIMNASTKHRSSQFHWRKWEICQLLVPGFCLLKFYLISCWQWNQSASLQMLRSMLLHPGINRGNEQQLFLHWLAWGGSSDWKLWKTEENSAMWSLKYY